MKQGVYNKIYTYEREIVYNVKQNVKSMSHINKIGEAESTFAAYIKGTKIIVLFSCVFKHANKAYLKIIVGEVINKREKKTIKPVNHNFISFTFFNFLLYL